MKKIHGYFLLIIFLVNTGCSQGVSGVEPLQSKDSGSSPLSADDPSGRYSWPHSSSDLEPDPALVTGRFKNGLRYVIIKNKKPDGRVSLHLDIQAGSGYENPGEEGIAHFLEHMLFNGTKSYPPGELVKYFQGIGMNYGSDLNARTGYDSAVYDIMLPSGDEKTLDRGLSVLSEFAGNALLLENEVEKEKGVILSEKRQRNNAEYRIMVAMQKFLYEGLRIPERIPIGSEQVIRTATKRLIKDFYDAWYRPERMMVVIAGDTDVKKAESLVEKNFAGIKSRALKRDEPPLGKVGHKGEKPFYHYEKEAGSATVGIEVVRSVMPGPDTLKSEQAMISRMMAMTVLQERLDSVSRKKGAPFTSAESGTAVSLREIDRSAVYAGCLPENWEKAMEAISKEIETAKKFGFSREETERVKKRMLASLDRAISTAPTRDSKVLANEIIDNMNEGRVFISPEYQKKMFAPFIEALTSENLEKSFREIWRDDHRLVMLAGNAEIRGGFPEKQVLAAYRKGKSLASGNTEGQAAIKFPYLVPSSGAGRIAKETGNNRLGIRQIDFENGARLNLKRTDFKADEIMMVVAFGNGNFSAPPGKAGLGFLSEAVINDSGTGRLSSEDLAKALAGKNVSLDFQTGDERFYYQGTSSRKDIRTLFELVYARITDPGFREEAFSRKIKQHEQDYSGLIKSVDGIIRIKAPLFFSGADKRFMIPEPAVLARTNLADIKNWAGRQMMEEPLEISIAGDFDDDEIIDLASFYFGSMKKRKPFGASPHAILNFPSGKNLDLSVESQAENAFVHMAWPAYGIKGMSDLKEIRRLNVLAAVLENRLLKEIREKLGASYSPAAAFDIEMAYEGSAALYAMVAASPEKVSEIRKIIMDIASGLAHSEISDEEFKEALNPLLTALKEKLKNNAYWTLGVMTGSKQNPERLFWSENALKDHESIKKTDISALAKKNFDSKKAGVITVKSTRKKITEGIKNKKRP